VSRYDKYSPRAGGFRAKLNAAWNATSGPAGVSDLNRIIVVELNASGRLIKATSAVTACGIVVLTGPKAAGDVVDVMTAGEVVEVDGNDVQGGVAPTAGQRFFFDATASRLALVAAPVAGTNYFLVGRVVEATRLVVRCGLLQG
jgi:hypothetical protein